MCVCTWCEHTLLTECPPDSTSPMFPSAKLQPQRTLSSDISCPRVGVPPLSAGGTPLPLSPAAAFIPYPPPLTPLTLSPGVGWGLGLLLSSSMRQDVQTSRGLTYPHPVVFFPELPLGPLSCLGGLVGGGCHGVRPGAEGAGCHSFRATLV